MNDRDTLRDKLLDIEKWTRLLTDVNAAILDLYSPNLAAATLTGGGEGADVGRSVTHVPRVAVTGGKRQTGRLGDSASFRGKPPMKLHGRYYLPSRIDTTVARSLPRKC